MYRAYAKRILDLILSAGGLLLLSPLLVVVALMICFSDGMPVLFRQQRPGLLGSPFTLLKFRTMTLESNRSGQLIDDNQRITSLGGIIRAMSLDELPELFNVLKGDMSLVGPRPLLMEYLDRYTPDQARRHEVRPGITGLAQVSGRNAISWEQKFQYDVWYVDHVSLLLDVKILANTVVSVLSRKGISAAGHASMPRFMGSKDAGRNGSVPTDAAGETR